jgi:hypothetical protein
MVASSIPMLLDFSTDLNFPASLSTWGRFNVRLTTSPQFLGLFHRYYSIPLRYDFETYEYSNNFCSYVVGESNCIPNHQFLGSMHLFDSYLDRYFRQGIDASQDICLDKQTHAMYPFASDIRNQGSSVRAIENSTRIEPRGHYDRRILNNLCMFISEVCYKPEGRGFNTRLGEFLHLANPSGRTRPWGLLSL